MSRAAQRAATSQALASLAAERSDPPAQITGQLNMAARVAGWLAEEFGSDTERAGRVAVASSRHLAAVLFATRAGSPSQCSPEFLVSVLARAGGMLAGQSPTGETE